MNSPASVSLHPALDYFLDYFLRQHPHDRLIQPFKERLKKADSHTELINIYNDAIPHIENLIWREQIDDATLEKYQSIFKELENIHSECEKDNRHNFIVAIPVADRPAHLNTCLNSLLNLCKSYRYGGFSRKDKLSEKYPQGKYNKIRVLIADDSKHKKHIFENMEMAHQYCKQGLEVIYFGQQEQKKIIEKLNSKSMENIFGDVNVENFYHKGASVTRNISYLKLRELSNNDPETLFYFIDSDQEFQIKLQTEKGDTSLYAINFFYYLDRAFTTENISVLTGKVVGDPPVSPSVMAANLLDDLIFFIQTIATYKPEQSCQFHQFNRSRTDDAAYHDMADLFGFKPPENSTHYHCKTRGEHDHIACFSDLAEKLKQFFDGAHPTKNSYYQHEDFLKTIKPARTIYTGNYIFNQKGMNYFIPFASLKLRMAGPTLGRIIKADTGNQFVSANLPMLHNRTVNTTGKAEFRPGVNHKKSSIDISDEFSRQFFGDIMLFSIQELCETGYPEKKIPHDIITETVEKMIKYMLDKYSSRHHDIENKILTLTSLIKNPRYWWNSDMEQVADIQSAKLHFNDFLNNINFNFGKYASGYRFIHSSSNQSMYTKKIADAIISFPDDRAGWTHALKNYSIK